MEYKFVFKNGGWWLKVNTLSQLEDYYNKVDSNRISKGFLSAIYSKEFSSNGTEHASNIGYLIGIHASNNHLSFMQSALDIQYRKFKSQSEWILKGYNIYINRVGGWHYGKNDYTQWYDKDVLIFPDFKKNQIKVEKFPGGEHFYAYIDNMQVRNGDILKWNTYGEAYDNALRLVEKENEVLC